jgi:hypothetical protein
MRTSKIELDIDFIGGQGPLTTEEEKTLSDFFKKRKSEAKSDKKAKVTKRPKTTA